MSSESRDDASTEEFDDAAQEADAAAPEGSSATPAAEAGEVGEEDASAEPAPSQRRMPQKREKKGKKSVKSASKSSGKSSSSKSNGGKSSSKSNDDKSSGKSSVDKPSDDSEKTDASEGAIAFLCVHCGGHFRADTQPSRCPSCMRRDGIERAFTEKAKRPAWLLPAAALLVVAIGGGAYALFSAEDAVSSEGALTATTPLDTDALRSVLEAQRAPADWATILEADEKVETWASHAEGQSDVAKAEALVTQLQSLSRSGEFEKLAMERPRDTPPMRAEEVAAALDAEQAPVLYPLEVAALAVAALREADVPAMVAEIWQFPGDESPPDPSAKLGYFAIALEEADGSTRFLDPYGGHTTPPDQDHARVLSDAQVVAAYLGTQALYELVHESDSVSALRAVDAALRLDERSPYLRSTRAAVLIVNGGPQEGIEELEAAAQLRRDGPRRNNIAGVLLATGDVGGASREAGAALEEFPGFAGAHATMAAIYLGEGEMQRAQTSLQTAERLSPDQELLPMLWAQYYLRTGDPMRATSHARRAIEKQPHSWQAHLNAAQVFRATSEYGLMRQSARQAMSLIAPSQRAALRQQILSVLGPTALEEEEDWDEIPLGDLDEGIDDPDELDELGDLDDWDSELQLESEILGGPSASGGSGPSLLGEDERLGEGSLGLGGSGGGYTLGGGGGGLRLEL